MRRPVAVAISGISRGGFAWVLAAGELARRERRLTPLLVTAGATWGANAAAVLASRLIGRPRPCERGRPAVVDCPDSPSLPSNHAASAAAGALTLGHFAPRLRPLLVTAAAAVAASRVRVGVHHPSDVAAGAVVGALGAAVALRLSDGRA